MKFKSCNHVLLSIKPNKASSLITYNYRNVITTCDYEESWFRFASEARCETGIARFGLMFLQRQRHWHDARYQLHVALFRWHITHSFADIHVAAILYGNLALIVRYLRSRCERRNTLTDHIVPFDSRSPS